MNGQILRGRKDWCGYFRDVRSSSGLPVGWPGCSFFTDWMHTLCHLIYLHPRFSACRRNIDASKHFEIIGKDSKESVSWGALPVCTWGIAACSALCILGNGVWSWCQTQNNNNKRVECGLADKDGLFSTCCDGVVSKRASLLKNKILLHGTLETKRRK